MFVVKRDGRHEDVFFDKITDRVKALSYDLDVEATRVSQKVGSGLVSGMSTQDLDVLTTQVASDLGVYHSDYQLLAGRIAASNLQKTTCKTFSEAMSKLFHDKRVNVISEEVYRISQEYSEIIDSAIHHERDLTFNIFGIETLKRSYLLRTGDNIVETPQYMFMRVSLGLHSYDVTAAIEMYELLSQKFYTHSSPTLFNSGTPTPQLASCFLLTMEDDSIDGIYNTLKECALISKAAGGIGFNIHDIRSTGSHIKGTNGRSSGIVPMLRVFNETAKYVDQAGKRKGAFAAYLEPHHADVFDFIDLRKQGGNLEFRTHDMFVALWVSDLFMERVKNDQEWSLFDPNTAHGLSDVYGEKYKSLYEKYESDNIAIRTIKARELWTALMVAQAETGTPYIVNKDQANLKSNQKNLGTIKNSNLCAEILEYSSQEETAVCTLASINLSRFIKDGEYNFEHLTNVARSAVKNLNLVIDRTFYPSEKARMSNTRHRPLGLGVSGLHDVFFQLKLDFDSLEARKLNKRIFETIYRASILESIELAKRDGAYETFSGSPAAQGILQFDMWGLKKTDLFYDDWSEIKGQVVLHGLRNSLLVALMPTASSATIMGVTEAFEAQTSNIYSRKVLSGEYSLVNKYLVKELSELGLWDEQMVNKIIANDGSVQMIENIPAEIRKRYRTVWEISQKAVIDMSADRGPFVCQTQSMNLFLSTPTIPKLTAMYLYAHQKGLKTMCYYLRRRATTEAVQFTVENECVSCSA